MTDVNSPSLDPVEAGAPEKEIEITPEMIEAGATELYRHDLDLWEKEKVRRAVADIFLSMLRAAPN